MNIQTFWNKLADIFFPEADRCPFCNAEGGFCEKCREALQNQRIEDHAAVFRYDGIVRDLIRRLKFSGQAHLASPMADLIEEAVDLLGDIITCVPLHPRRKRMRGYNQSALIAKRLSELTGIPYAPLIVKTRNTPPQSLMKSRAERLANIRGAFRIKGTPDLTGKHILLTDDVFTTGATAEECITLLKQAGAESVRVITFAKGGALWQPQEHCSEEH